MVELEAPCNENLRHALNRKHHDPDARLRIQSWRDLN
jgi:hypothetical protein